MSEESEIKNADSTLARAGKRKWGYDPKQVDSFLEKAHSLYERDEINMTLSELLNVSFDLVKGGYVIPQVDAALERLQTAVVDKNTQHEIKEHGRVAWKAGTEELFRQIESHASREEGERFADGEGKAPSYDRKQVDHLVNLIVQKASQDLKADNIGEPEDYLPGQEHTNKKDEEELGALDSEKVANTVFTQRKGKRGYDEHQVDYYLNACVDLLSRLESYQRIAKRNPALVEAPAAQQSVAAHVPQPSSQDADSLFSHAASVPPQQPVNLNDQDSFNALHEAEAAIFTANADSPLEDNLHVIAPPSFAPAYSIKPSASVTVDTETTHYSAMGHGAVGEVTESYDSPLVNDTYANADVSTGSADVASEQPSANESISSFSPAETTSTYESAQSTSSYANTDYSTYTATTGTSSATFQANLDSASTDDSEQSTSASVIVETAQETTQPEKTEPSPSELVYGIQPITPAPHTENPVPQAKLQTDVHARNNENEEETSETLDTPVDTANESEEKNEDHTFLDIPTPTVPQLNISIPDLELPESLRHFSEEHPSPSQKMEDDPFFHHAYQADDFNTAIPDLSFPDFDDDPAEKKDEQ